MSTSKNHPTKRTRIELRIPDPSELKRDQEVMYMHLATEKRHVVYAGVRYFILRVKPKTVQLRVETPKGTLYRSVKHTSLRVPE